MSEDLVTCPTCQTSGFTPRGLAAHRCKGINRNPGCLLSEAVKRRKEAAAASSDPQAAIPDPQSGEAVVSDPWDQAREVSAQLRLCGRLFLRGQVKLGMILSALKKEFGVTRGCTGRNRSPESGDYLPWPELVKRETGYSRQSCDEFIRLYEAVKHKLKTAKKLGIPAPARKNAIVLFQAENPLALTDEQWKEVDAAIGSLTSGETQAGLMRELGLVPTPKPMPKGATRSGGDDDTTAGQLAFHFFDAVAAPLINARTNPDYLKMLHSLPAESSEEHPLSLATLEAEFRAALADIEDVRKASCKPAKGRTIN